MSEWNTLPLDVRQSDFIRIFKEKLIVKSNFVCDKARHDFYVLGDMYTNIVYYTPNFAIIVHLIVIYY